MPWGNCNGTMWIRCFISSSKWFMLGTFFRITGWFSYNRQTEFSSVLHWTTNTLHTDNIIVIKFYCIIVSVKSSDQILIIFRSTPPSRPNNISGSQMSVRPQKDFNEIWYVGRGWRVMHAWPYAVWHNPRSRSRAHESRKFNHFQGLSPPPFIMGTGKWPRCLKLRGNT